MPVVLREVRDDDLPVFWAHSRDEEARKMAAVEARDEEAFWAHWARLRADESTVTRTIVVDGEVAGHLLSFERRDRREVGYWLGREFWGRGVATSALAAFLRLERSRPLHAGVAHANTASRRVLEKCGFTVEVEDEGGFVILVREAP